MPVLANITTVDSGLNELSFSGTPTLISGSDKQAGASYKYSNIITVGSEQVDAIVTIEAIHDNASIDVLDTSYSDSRDNYFAPEITGGGSSKPNARVDFSFNFIDTDGDPVNLQNFRINSVDIDGPEFVEYGGFDSYTLSNSTDLATTPGSGNRIRFTGTGNYNGLIINNNGRVQTTFGSVQKIEMTMGVKQSTSKRLFGSIFKTIAFTTTTTDVSAPTVVSLSTSDTTPTITGTLTALSGSDTFAVTVNSNTYLNSGSELSVTGGTWSLTIPSSDALTIGTYDVTAIRKGLIDIPDQTSQELSVTGSINAAPVAVADSYTINEGGTLNGTTLLANDTDADNDTLTAIKLTDPINGSLNFNSNGTFT